MRQRNNKITFRLNDDELIQLNKLVKDINKSKESILRGLVKGVVLKPTPTKEMIEIVRELRRIGVNINQIAQVANSTNNIDVVLYKSNYNELTSYINRIIELVQSPIDIKDNLWQ